MKTTKLNDEVLIAQDSIVQIDSSDILELKQKAKKNPRKRIRICVHKDNEDYLHEMLIIHEKSCYVRPHKHINKTESFHIVEGVADIVIFNDDGSIEQIISMGDIESGFKFFYRLPPNLYHTILIKSEVLVFHEITNGPFNPNETNLAPWSPEEHNLDEVANYMAMLKSYAENLD